MTLDSAPGASIAVGVLYFPDDGDSDLRTLEIVVVSWAETPHSNAAETNGKQEKTRLE